MSLITISHKIVNFTSVVGCPMLANSATAVTCTSDTPGTVLTADGSELAANPYDYLTGYPILLKFFFSNVVMSGTVAYPNPEYVVTISGPKVFICHRIDEKDFGITIRIKDWSTKSLTTTVSLAIIPPLTGVSLSCLAGIALDTQDSPAEY
jgi:hypothetical protein